MAVKASGRAAERLAVVDETQADRQTIEIYELVTRKVRVGRVPLLFKALAAERALIPCWNALRPAIRVRAFEEAADDLRARAARAAVDLGCPLIETQLEWAGYDVDEIDQIRGQVDIFHYVDAKLLMAVAVLAEAVSGGVGGVSRGPRGEQRVPGACRTRWTRSSWFRKMRTACSGRSSAASGRTSGSGSCRTTSAPWADGPSIWSWPGPMRASATARRRLVSP